MYNDWLARKVTELQVMLRSSSHILRQSNVAHELLKNDRFKEILRVLTEVSYCNFQAVRL